MPEPVFRHSRIFALLLTIFTPIYTAFAQQPATPTPETPIPVPATPTPPVTPAPPLEHTPLREFGFGFRYDSDLSPDGRLIVTCGTLGLFLWDADTGGLIREFEGHTGTVFTARFSPDGVRIASGGEDFTVRIWETDTGELLQTGFGNRGYVHTLDFTPDGRFVFGGGSGQRGNPPNKDYAIKLWNADTGELVRRFSSHRAHVSRAIVSPDGASALTSDVDGNIMVWDMDTGSIRATATNPGGALGAAFAPDGQSFVTGGEDGVVRRWDAATGEPVGTYEGLGDDVRSLLFLDEARLAAGSANGKIMVWDAESGDAIHSWQPHSDYLNALSASDDGSLMLSSAYDSRVILWDTATWEPRTEIFAHTRRPNASSVSPDGSLAAFASSDGRVTVWNRETGALAQAFSLPDDARDIAFHSGGTTLAAITDNGMAFTLNTQNGAIASQLQLDPSYMQHETLSPDGRYLLSSDGEGLVSYFDLENGARYYQFESGASWIWDIAFSPDGQLGLFVGTNRIIHVWNVDNGRPRLTIDASDFPGENAIFGLAMSADKRYILAANNDGAIRIFDGNHGGLLRVRDAGGNYIGHTEFSPDGRMYLTLHGDDYVRVWDFITGEMLAEYGDFESAGTARFSPDGRYLVIGGEKSYVFDLSDLQPGGPAPDLATPTPSNTPTPTNTATITPTPPPPSNTPIPLSTFRPFEPTPTMGNTNGVTLLVPYLHVYPVVHASETTEQIGIDPETGDLYYAERFEVNTSWNGGKRFRNRVIGPVAPEGGILPRTMRPVFAELPLESVNFLVPSNGFVFAGGSAPTEILAARRNRITKIADIQADIALYMDAGDSFFGAQSNGILLYRDERDFYRLNPADLSVTPVEVPDRLFESFSYGFDELAFGPDGALHAINDFNGQFYRIEGDGSATELTPESIYRAKMVYLDEDLAWYYARQNTLYRWSVREAEPQAILRFATGSWWDTMPLLASPAGDRLYFYNRLDHNIWTLEPPDEPVRYISTPTPTMLPYQESPTVTPTPMEWLILDGYGGIHTSDGAERPVLPYFAPADIARDLEPDPLGRGWYMVDGYGGVHASSPELPMPSDLPYFLGLDIARDLEIIDNEGELTFVLLDGFGVAHVSGPGAPDIQSQIPWFGTDMARDLEPAGPDGGWLVLDAYGAEFDSRDFTVGVSTGAYWVNEFLAQDLLPLPSGERLSLDVYGGRHAEERSAALRRLKPIPPELYIYGFPIFKDIEAVR